MKSFGGLAAMYQLETSSVVGPRFGSSSRLRSLSYFVVVRQANLKQVANKYHGFFSNTFSMFAFPFSLLQLVGKIA